MYTISGRSRIYEGSSKRRTVYTKQSKENESYGQKENKPDSQSRVDSCIVHYDDTYKPFSCSEGEYCHLEYGKCNDTYDSDSFSGTCREIISRCTRELRPVCGCNDRTYANKCVALSKGTSIKYAGPCAG